LILQVYQSPLFADGNGHWRRPKDKELLHFDGADDFVPGHEQFWMTEAEWKSLVPSEPKKGQQLTVAAALADRLARQTLFDHSCACYHPWEPKDVRSLRMTLAVEEVSDTEIRLCLQGSVHLEAAADDKTLELTSQVRAQPRRRCLPASEEEKPFYRYQARLLG